MTAHLQSFLESWGYIAIFVFGVLEAMCIPISSELTFLLGGALSSSALQLQPGQHHLNLALVIVLGTVAEMIGSFISYGVGRAGGRPLVHRWGKFVLVTEHDVNRAERFLVGRGAWALPVARMLPLVRAFASIVAGIVEIPPVRFGVLNAIGTVIYIVALSSIGYALGGSWTSFNKSFSDASYVLIGLVVLVIIAAVVVRVREFRKESAYAGRHGGTTPVRSDRDRSARLYRYRARRGSTRGHRHPGGDHDAFVSFCPFLMQAVLLLQASVTG